MARAKRELAQETGFCRREEQIDVLWYASGVACRRTRLRGKRLFACNWRARQALLNAVHVRWHLVDVAPLLA